MWLNIVCINYFRELQEGLLAHGRKPQMPDVSKFINYCPKIYIVFSNLHDFFIDFDGDKNNILGQNEHFSYWYMGLILIQEVI